MNTLKHLAVSSAVRVNFTNVSFRRVLRVVSCPCGLLCEANTASISILAATVKYLSSSRGAGLFLNWQRRRPIKIQNRRPRRLVGQSASFTKEANWSKTELITLYWVLMRTCHLSWFRLHLWTFTKNYSKKVCLLLAVISEHITTSCVTSAVIT